MTAWRVGAACAAAAVVLAASTVPFTSSYLIDIEVQGGGASSAEWCYDDSGEIAVNSQDCATDQVKPDAVSAEDPGETEPLSPEVGVSADDSDDSDADHHQPAGHDVEAPNDEPSHQPSQQEPAEQSPQDPTQQPPDEPTAEPSADPESPEPPAAAEPVPAVQDQQLAVSAE